ncbi:hypothetical protein [Bailinhaonella thermotolerans]|uniref:Uncharacterized protein n=1 Tax=Bailinhaonella thermotolerans TaxID=1070861 RepID=A0A3A4AYJ5_9ACTN|nr:hypothetical protein [Bailinhaonella thermotolerans]RJL32576.1 hypothetical protein D5H75_13730 [Bailinhaonella thermotolerans]
MPLKAKVRERVRPFLPPGEELHYLFPATAMVSHGGGMFHTLVAVTETRVVVIACKWLTRDKPDSIWAAYPRAIQLGPVEMGSLGPAIHIGDLTLEVDEEYVPVVRAADAEISPADHLPPDPLPDL